MIMKTGLFLSAALCGAAAGAGAHPHSALEDPHAAHKQHMKFIEANGIVPVESRSNHTVASQSGSFVTTVYTTMTCQKDTEYTASGVTLGSCISASDVSSYKYTSCSVQGSKTMVGMTSCTSGDCTAGCSDYQIPFDTGCQTMSMMTCSSKDEPWEAYNFDYHALMYFGNKDCGGDYDQWTAVDADIDDCEDLDCYSYDNHGTSYSMEGFCS